MNKEDIFDRATLRVETITHAEGVDTYRPAARLRVALLRWAHLNRKAGTWSPADDACLLLLLNALDPFVRGRVKLGRAPHTGGR